MEIKKLPSWQKGIDCYTFEASPEKLTSEILEVCRALKKGMFVVEVFIPDELNHWLHKHSQRSYSLGNFNYYVCENMDFLATVDFCSMRHIMIYSISVDVKDGQFSRQYLEKHYTLCICFENYCDTNELRIRRQAYETDKDSVLC